MTRVAAALIALATLASCASSGVHIRRHVVFAGRPSAAVATTSSVWVADDASQSVVELDQRGRLLGLIPVSRNPVALASGGGAVWVGHASGVVIRIDTSTQHASAPFVVGGSITSVAFRSGSVWAADLPGDALVEIDAGTQKVRRRLRVPAGPVRVVAAGASLWTTNRENTVTRLDPGTGRELTVRVGNGPIGLCFDGKRIWVANSDDDTVSRLDAVTGMRAGPDIRVGRGPVAVAASRGVVWVANQDDRTVVAIDGDTGRVTGGPVGVGTHLRGLAPTSEGVWAVGTDPGAAVLVAP